ncbi:MAG: hypothetical protein GY694_13545 [Gammaproteobacteria bacterium]|nr:hypothetical protein [Gammaproteobacteria bacterium]
MMVKNDQALKKVLSNFSIADQRKVAAQFIDSVLSLNSDPLIARILQTIKKETYTEADVEEMYKQIKSLVVKTYTACGDDANWSSQAAHFVATATKACVTPEKHLSNHNNLSWKCAMQTRMARSSEMIETESDVIDNEAEKQYEITNEVLNL